jgi:hypothetical protein
MRIKLHIGILILILTILGVASRQQIALANQEIVLQFNNIEVSSDEAQKTLLILKRQLLDLGVDNLNITEEETGILKITYYSDINVALVKESLSKENRVVFNYVSNDHKEEEKHSSDEKALSYDIIINEIQNAHDAYLVLGEHLVKPKSENDRSHEPILFPPSNISHIVQYESIDKIRLKSWRHIASSKDNLSYIFPEVRAGPQAVI